MNTYLIGWGIGIAIVILLNAFVLYLSSKKKRKIWRIVLIINLLLHAILIREITWIILPIIYILFEGYKKIKEPKKKKTAPYL